MIPAEEIEEFLKGSDPEQYIVSVEFDYVSDSIYKIIEDPIKGKIVKRDTFIPFAWVGDLRGLNFYQGSKGLQKEAMSKYGIVIDKLLKSLIVSDIDYNELLVGDKNAMMIAARILAYGKDYEFE